MWRDILLFIVFKNQQLSVLRGAMSQLTNGH